MKTKTEQEINPQHLAAAERWAGSNRRRFMQLSMWEAKKQFFLAGCEYITNQLKLNENDKERKENFRNAETH
jgi:hypothetical protein